MRANALNAHRIVSGGDELTAKLKGAASILFGLAGRMNGPGDDCVGLVVVPCPWQLNHTGALFSSTTPSASVGASLSKLTISLPSTSASSHSVVYVPPPLDTSAVVMSFQ